MHYVDAVCRKCTHAPSKSVCCRLHRQSLALDLAQYQGQALSAMTHLAPMVELMMSNSSRPFGRTRGTLKLVLIVNNTLLQPDNKQDIYHCERPCYHHVLGQAAATPSGALRCHVTMCAS
jgi:hypothetical protein